jgi:hypothetical protein
LTFALTIGLMWVLARWWTANVGNRVLTVGITYLAARYRPRRRAAATTIGVLGAPECES